MKIAKSRLKDIIKEELTAVLGHPVGGCGDHPEEPESDIEGLASGAIAMIHQLATAAGADMSTDVEAGDEELEEKKEEKWIQGAEKDIEKRGTEGVCTGDKFGGPTCKPGTKRYNLAKTFRKMAKDKKK